MVNCINNDFVQGPTAGVGGGLNLLRQVHDMSTETSCKLLILVKNLTTL